MKKSEAIKHLRILLTSIQKFRSNAREELGSSIDFDMLADMYPWTFGDKCQIPTLSKIINHYEDTGELEPIAYQNQMYILFNFTPEIMIPCIFEDSDFPATKPPIIVAWDEEETCKMCKAGTFLLRKSGDGSTSKSCRTCGKVYFTS